MLLHAMLENQADGCAMLEAHEDPEVVRLRLGKALDFEYNEVSEPDFKRAIWTRRGDRPAFCRVGESKAGSGFATSKRKIDADCLTLVTGLVRRSLFAKGPARSRSDPRHRARPRKT